MLSMSEEPGVLLNGADLARQKRSMTLAGHRTSLALERIFWRLLEEEAAKARLSLAALVARIDAARVELGMEVPLAAALRVHCVLRLEQAPG